MPRACKDHRRRGANSPGMLHIHPKNKDQDEDQTGEADTNSSLVAVQISGLTEAGNHDSKLSIVPVKVKSKTGQK